MSVIENGLVVLTQEDAIARREIQTYLSKLLEKAEYLPIFSPHIAKIPLFETSGHYPYYKEDMFTPIKNDEHPSEWYLLKPMNCPFHIQGYQETVHSYRELPIRYYEFGTVYRNEASGAINGMFRLRGFTQDDGHIFCTPDQIADEVKSCVDLINIVMNKLGMTVWYRLSTYDPTKKGKYIGDNTLWQLAQEQLEKALPDDRQWETDLGGAAFYGPKIDFVANDKLGREWQLGTVQLDFNLPERFELKYRDADNTLKTPVMIHRALLGSIERFIAILREQGPLPLWLRSEQVRIIPVHEAHVEYALECKKQLKASGIRVYVEEEVAPLNAKIKKAKEAGIPYVAVVGDKEKLAQTLAVNNTKIGLSDFVCGVRLAIDS